MWGLIYLSWGRRAGLTLLRFSPMAPGSLASPSSVLRSFSHPLLCIYHLTSAMLYHKIEKVHSRHQPIFKALSEWAVKSFWECNTQTAFTKPIWPLKGWTWMKQFTVWYWTFCVHVLSFVGFKNPQQFRIGTSLRKRVLVRDSSPFTALIFKSVLIRSCCIREGESLVSLALSSYRCRSLT